jgi:hypothetical protein
MRLAREATSAKSAVWKRHTALPFYVHRPLRLRTLRFRFVFLLLLCAGLLSVAVDLALLALLCARLEAFDCRLPGPDIVVVFALFSPECGIFGLLGFLLLPLLVSFFVQAFADVCRRSGAKDRSAAVLALYRVDLVVKGAAGLESSECLLVERVYDRGPSRRRLAVGVYCTVRSYATVL